jgi:cell wall-associated NlpC family hydrolase
MSKKLRMIIITALITTLVGIGFGAVTHAEASTTTIVHYYGTVTEGPLNVRTGASSAYSSLGKLSVGTKITVLAVETASDGKWYKISYKSKTGYVYSKYVKLTGSQTFYGTPKTATVFQGPLNVRSGPSTASAIIGSASYLKVLSVKSLYYKYGSGKWLRITWNGQTGYVAAKYVAVNTRGCTIKKYSSAVSGTAKVSTALRTGPGSGYSGSTQLTQGKSRSFIGEVVNGSGEKWLLCNAAYGIYYVAAKDVSTSSQTATTNAQKIVSLAYSKLGSAYVYGAEGPNSFDCSGFVYWVVNNSGISGLSVPRSSYDLYNKYKSYNIGTSVANAKPGDIILFSNNGSASGICHSAIYYKDSKMIHASSPDTGVILTLVSYSTSNKSVFAIIRLPGL